MKKFLVNIWAYDHHAKFQVLSEDNAISLEQSILDKLGDKSINWEYLGNNYNNEISRITYEEVDDGKQQYGVVRKETETREQVERDVS